MMGPLRGALGPLGVSAGAAAAPWWAVAGQTCVAAYKPIGESVLATSYINLANPGMYNAAPGVAPTLGAGGWGFDGTQYLDTGIVPGIGWSILVRFSDYSGGCLFGVKTFAFHWSILPFGGPGVDYLFAGGDNIQAPTMTEGMLGIAGANGYRNGSFDKALSGTPSFGELMIGIGLTGAFHMTGTIAALAIYSTTLTGADVAALTTRMAAL